MRGGRRLLPHHVLELSRAQLPVFVAELAILPGATAAAAAAAKMRAGGALAPFEPLKPPGRGFGALAGEVLGRATARGRGPRDGGGFACA